MDRATVAPYGRAGSKAKLAPWINGMAAQIAHRRWGEAFAGTAAVTLTKMPVTWEFLNDRCAYLSNFLKVMRSAKNRRALTRKLRYSGWEERDFSECCKIVKGLLPAPADPVEMARVFLVYNVQSYNHSGRTHVRSATVDVLRRWGEIERRIEGFARRIARCHIFSLDYSEVLRLPEVNHPETLTYCDPPYVGVEKVFYSSNKCEGFDHRAFRKSLDEYQGSVMVSYEEHPIIHDLYLTTDGWTIRDQETTRAMGNNGKHARELLLMRLSDWARARGAIRSRKQLRELFDEDGNAIF